MYLKLYGTIEVPLLELIVRNIARYPQSATSTSIRYQPDIRYLVPWVSRLPVHNYTKDAVSWRRRVLKCGFDIPPCLLVVVAHPHPTEPSSSFVRSNNQALAPFGQYVAWALRIFSRHLHFILTALCLYNLLSHGRDVAAPVKIDPTDALSYPLAIPTRGALSSMDDYPSSLATTEHLIWRLGSPGRLIYRVAAALDC
jgi:hypothetical protein